MLFKYFGNPQKYPRKASFLVSAQEIFPAIHDFSDITIAYTCGLSKSDRNCSIKKIEKKNCG